MRKGKGELFENSFLSYQANRCGMVSKERAEEPSQAFEVVKTPPACLGFLCPLPHKATSAFASVLRRDSRSHLQLRVCFWSSARRGQL